MPIRSASNILAMVICTASMGAGAAFAQSVPFAPPHGATEFGPGPQTLVIGPAEFRPLEGAEDNYSFFDLYLRGSAGVRMRAPVHLPEGARIVQVCWHYRDLGSDDPIDSLSIAFRDQGMALEVAPTARILGADFITGDDDDGYSFRCFGPPDPPNLESVADINGDGSPEFVSHYLQIQFSGDLLHFGGARIVWFREVSPPPAVPSFDDVPADSPFFRHIEALAASGITQGCDPDSFCPGAPLTRGQMAVFLARALGLHWHADLE